MPVILDTDIGDDIDDTWVLELAGRTDISIGIGIKENDDSGPQAER